MSAHIGDLQQQVETLAANMNSLKHQVELQSVGAIGTPFGPQDYPRAMSIGQNSMIPPSPARMKSRSSSKHPRFHGPTSSTFSLGVAKSSLKTMGITGHEDGEDEGIATQDATPMASPRPVNAVLHRPTLHADKDPIWALTKHDALRLVHVWHEEMGMMYPFLDIDKVTRHAERLFSFIEAACKAGLMQGALPGADAIQDDQTNILKMMLAIALILEGNGKDPLGERLFSNVLHVIERTLSESVDLKSIHVLTISVSTALRIRSFLLTSPGHVPLPPRRRTTRLAHRRASRPPVLRDGSPPTGDVRLFHRCRGARRSCSYLLVCLCSRSAVELWNWTTLRFARIGH